MTGRRVTSRRTLLALAGASAASIPARGEGAEGLHARAARKGLVFGAALEPRHLRETGFQEAFLAECGLLVGEGAQQWRRMERDPGRDTAADADFLAAFAAEHRVLLRGHALWWHRAIPDWARSLDNAAFRRAAEARVAAAGARWRGRIRSWDVVNEAVRPVDGRADGLRDSQFPAAFGPDWISRAFHLARAADPGAMLVYNDYGFEHALPDHREKRTAVLRLLEGLVRSGVPVDAFGVQGHLFGGAPFSATEWRGFLRDVAALGLTVLVTELDVNDRLLPADAARRDPAVADLVRHFLDATLAESSVRGVITWGLADRHSWIRGNLPSHQRTDTALPRPLPLDDDLARKPMWHAIAAALDAAPSR